ncbi:MAG: NAD(P)H-dependent oxidoreductase [Azoarcus sp.]|jgi:FMN-dependent NADH-azoreductase|nr:NAD(P)H-dependent oxidoreductase [Azoarcus sp.]
MNILQINSSIQLENSHSSRIAGLVVERLRALHPDAKVTVRDLGRDPLPPLDVAAVAALFTPTDKRTHEQMALVAKNDVLIAELQAANVLVLGVPMYNLGIPVQLKGWIDAISRAGVTFRYTATGPEGLVKGKKVYVALARGGRYRDTALDTQVPYLKAILGFLGMTDVQFIYGEGFAMGAESVQQTEHDITAQIAALQG